VIGDSRFLRRLRDAINIGNEIDHRFSGAPRGFPGRGNAGDAALHVKAMLLEDAGHVARGLKFLEAQLAVAENFVDHLLRQRSEAVDLRDGFFFQGVSRRRLLRLRRLADQQGQKDGGDSSQKHTSSHRIPPWREAVVRREIGRRRDAGFRALNNTANLGAPKSRLYWSSSPPAHATGAAALAANVPGEPFA